jgi:hypothetical protein
MEIQFNHFWGSQERSDLCITECIAKFEKNEEQYALQNGWIYDKGTWVQVRSTRVDLSKYRSTKKISHDISYEWARSPLIHINRLTEIYDNYIQTRNLRDMFNPFNSIDENRDLYLIVKLKGIICGFSKLFVHNGGIESAISPWHSDFRKYGIGWVIIDLEAAEAKRRNFDYLYIGPGYERGSSYKSKLLGFEWWNGRYWSKNLNLYRILCDRDSNVETIQDLSNAKDNLTND